MDSSGSITDKFESVSDEVNESRKFIKALERMRMKSNEQRSPI